MKKCCICGSEITRDDAPILFVSDYGKEDKEICDRCTSYIELILSGDLNEDVRNSLDFFRKKYNQIADKDVRNYVGNMVGVVSDVVETKKIENSYISETNIWIKGLKIFTWIVFVLTIVIGLVFAGVLGEAGAGGLGFLVFLVSLVVGFLSTAVVMVFLGIAQNIEDIRNAAVKKRK